MTIRANITSTHRTENQSSPRINKNPRAPSITSASKRAERTKALGNRANKTKNRKSAQQPANRSMAIGQGKVQGRVPAAGNGRNGKESLVLSAPPDKKEELLVDGYFPSHAQKPSQSGAGLKSDADAAKTRRKLPYHRLPFDKASRTENHAQIERSFTTHSRSIDSRNGTDAHSVQKSGSLTELAEVHKEDSVVIAMVAKSEINRLSASDETVQKSIEPDARPQEYPTDSGQGIFSASTLPKIHHLSTISTPLATDESASSNVEIAETALSAPLEQEIDATPIADSPLHKEESDPPDHEQISPDNPINGLITALGFKVGEESSENGQSPTGLEVIKHLQSEGVFGISPTGRNLSAGDFLKLKQFEYQMEQKPFAADALLREAQQAIYDTLNSGHGMSATRSLLRAAEAINAYRNDSARTLEAQKVSAPARKTIHAASTKES